MKPDLFPRPSGPAPLTPKRWAHWTTCNYFARGCRECREVAAAIRKEREVSRG